MLPVKNGMIGRTIDQSRVVSVAKGAIEEVLQGKPDESQYMNPVDQVYDLFCGKVKRLTIERVSGMSHHTAKLHTELERTGDKRRPDLINSEIAQIDQNKEGLSKLMQGSSLEFGYSGSRPIVDESSYLVYTDKSTSTPLGVALYPSPISGATQGSGEMDRILPNFLTAANIWLLHLQPIRAQGKIKVGEKEYPIRTFKLDEPIVICSSSDLFAKAVQSTLSALWIKEHAGRSKNELEQMERLEGTVRLPSILPELALGAIRSAAELAMERDWNEVSERAVVSLGKTAQKLWASLRKERAQLGQVFYQLKSDSVEHDQQRATLLDARKRLDDCETRLAVMRKDIEAVRRAYQKLFSLAIKCETPELRSIFTARIDNFSRCLQNYNASAMSRDDVNAFNNTRHTQDEFLRNFDETQFLLCTNLLHPPPLLLRPRTVVAHPPLATIQRKELIRRLKNPDRIWIQTKDAMNKLGLAQGRLLEALMFKIELVKRLNGAFLAFKGTDGYGMDPKTEKSFYTPETFSRIVTLREMRAELLDTSLRFTMDALKGKDGTIAGHQHFIESETVALDQSEKLLGFFGKPVRYFPEKDKDTGQYLNHMQWKNFQRTMKLLVAGIP